MKCLDHCDKSCLEWNENKGVCNFYQHIRDLLYNKLTEMEKSRLLRYLEERINKVKV